MISSTEQYALQAKKILQDNNEHTQISVTSLSNKGIDYFTLFFKQISSTMLLSEKWNHQSVNENTIIIFVAARQTQGRGQRTNTWESPLGNIMMTMLAKLPLKVIPQLQIVVLNSIANVVESQLDLAEPFKFKWVNDLFLGDQKTGGILIKSNIVGDQAVFQIGIGINTNENPVESSTCVKNHLKTVESISRQKMDVIINKIAIQIKTSFNEFQDIIEKTHKQYNERIEYKNQDVVIYDMGLKNILHRGKFVGVANSGFALLDIEGVGIKEISDGRMRKH